MFSVGVFILICALAENYGVEGRKRTHEASFRIIDGQLADIKEFPHQVSIMLNGSHHCGGSIISTKFILTAAHCTNQLPDYIFSVRVGSNTIDTGGEVHEVDKVFTNPKFTYKYENDVALLKLKSKLLFNLRIQPVKLPVARKRLPPVGTLALVSGWGRTNASVNQMSPHLLSLEVPLIPYKLCKKLYNDSKYIIDDKMFCAGQLKGGADSCLGDSGGAMIIEGLQYGIVSWGVGCGLVNRPGVYALVPRLRDYIKEISGI